MPRADGSVLIVALALAQIGGPPAGRVPVEDLASLSRADDPVLRVVGDVELRASDVWRVLDLTAPTVSEDVMREMVLTTLARQEAVREGIDVPADKLEAEIEKAMSEQRARFAVAVDAETPLEVYLRERHGMQPAEYRAEVRRMVLASLVLERVVRLHQWRTSRDELQIILVEDEALARELSVMLADGASFTVLAKKHSLHPGAAEGGFMPPLPADVPVPLVEGRGSLSPGEVLGPAPITVEGQDYWRFIRLVDRHAALIGPWAELRDRIEADLEERPLHPDEVAIFEARMIDRYRVRIPSRSS